MDPRRGASGPGASAQRRVSYEHTELRQRKVDTLCKQLTAGEVLALHLHGVRLSAMRWGLLARAVSEASPQLAAVTLSDTVVPEAAYRLVAKWGRSPRHKLAVSGVTRLPAALTDPLVSARCLGEETLLLEKMAQGLRTPLPEAAGSLPEMWAAAARQLSSCRDAALRGLTLDWKSHLPCAQTHPSVLMGAQGMALYNNSAACGVSPEQRARYAEAWAAVAAKACGVPLDAKDTLPRLSTKGVAEAVERSVTPDRLVLDRVDSVTDLQTVVTQGVLPVVVEKVLEGGGVQAGVQHPSDKDRRTWLRVMLALKLESLYPHQGESALDTVAVTLEAAVKPLSESLVRVLTRQGSGGGGARSSEGEPRTPVRAEEALSPVVTPPGGLPDARPCAPPSDLNV